MGWVTFYLCCPLDSHGSFCLRVTGSLNLSYNADFQVVAASVNGNTVNYGYDNDGLLLQAGSLQLSHHAQNGLLLGTQLGNVTTQRSYNNFGELQEETASYQSSPLFHSYYVRDKVGRITQKLETFAGLTISTEYAYDVAGRLIEVKQNGSVVETYQYDANGNRLNNNIATLIPKMASCSPRTPRLSTTMS